MSLFRRKKSAPEEVETPADVGAADVRAAELGAGEETTAAESSAEGTTGPWDVADVGALGARLDLGSVRLPVRKGITVRMEVERSSGRPASVSVSRDGSTLQIQAFAAPRSAGIWDEIVDELVASVKEKGGSEQVVDGPFGKEVRASLPVRTAAGKQGKRSVRFLGVDGPRWLLRGVLSGPAATDDAKAQEFEDIFRDVVVVRGVGAHPPRDLLPLVAPGAGGSAGADADTGGKEDPSAILRRGPEITETR